MKQLYPRICEYCKKPFTAKNKNAVYCSNGCRVMSYKIRNNIPIPKFRIDEISNRIPTKSEMQIREKTARLKDIENTINLYKEEYEKLLLKKLEPYDDILKTIYDIHEYRLQPSENYYNKSFIIALREYYTNIGYYEKEKNLTTSHKSFDNVIPDREEKKEIINNARIYLIQYYLKIKENIINEFEQNNPYKSLKEEAEQLTAEISVLHRGYSIEQMQMTGKLIDTNELLNMKFDLYELSEGFESVLGHPAKSFVGMIHGSAGSGKSSFAVKFASYFNSLFGKVCYLPIEEGLSFTFMQKIKKYAEYGDFNIIVETTPSKIQKLSENYSLVIIDSISQLNFNTLDVEEIIRYRRTTNTSFLFIMHQNKDKTYKGESSMGHLVDIELEADNGIVTASKNRFRLNNLSEYNYKIF